MNQASDVVSANIPPTLLGKGHEPWLDSISLVNSLENDKDNTI